MSVVCIRPDLESRSARVDRLKDRRKILDPKHWRAIQFSEDRRIRCGRKVTTGFIGQWHYDVIKTKGGMYAGHSRAGSGVRRKRSR